MAFSKVQLVLGVIFSCILFSQKVVGENKRPNIIYFLVDDWGFNDVGYYGNTETQTPFINKLVSEESLRIDKHYVMPECTATRCALLTGRYPIRYGMQSGILYYQSAYALSNREYLLSNEFKSHGYKTHLVGKWHLGMMSWDYTPTYRGFDTFLGFYAGLIYYYSHLGIESQYPNKIDFHNNEEGYNKENEYTLYTYEERILNIIDESKEEAEGGNGDPFFLYVGWQGSHNPSESPDAYFNMYNKTTSFDRKHFQAQTTLTDELLENIVNYLKENDMWDNTLLVVSSDNGAEWGYGDNSPLRGSKFTLWEGGIRVPAFVTGGYLPESRKGKVLNDIAMHVTDWYPTLLSAANINPITEMNTPNILDGMDFWDIISLDKNEDFETIEEYELTIRNDNIDNERFILLNADSNFCDSNITGICGGILYASKWKLIVGPSQVASYEAGIAESNTCFWHRNFSINNENSDLLQCGDIPNDIDSDTCVCSDTLCLFNLENDPCEYYNVINEYSEIGDLLYNKLKELYDNQAIVLFEETTNVAAKVAAKYDESGYWEPWYEATTTDFDGWETLSFEIMLEKYYNINNNNSNDNENISIVWIGLAVAAIGVFVCGVFILFRYWCMHRERRARINLRIDTNGSKTDLQPNDGRRNTMIVNNNNTENDLLEEVNENDETLPLTQNIIGNINGYSTSIQTNP